MTRVRLKPTAPRSRVKPLPLSHCAPQIRFVNEQAGKGNAGKSMGLVLLASKDGLGINGKTKTTSILLKSQHIMTR